MLKLLCLILTTVLLNYSLSAQELQYYLPQSIQYDPKIPSPKDIIGHHVGEWHVSHDKLVRYLESLAEVSDRITIETYGFTYEQRPLKFLTITTPENHQNLENIRKQHLKLSDPTQSNTLDISQMPVVVWMGYSVHGNEASGSNASILAAYYLAAAQGPEIEALLNNSVILIDPSINPDGMNRFASWVNSHRSKNLDGNPNSLEHNEAWPKGRTNHYWFDLNRDWLPVQHPESQARIAKFHYWRPNVLTDHHEMEAHRTFFFQPGIPARNHPITPQNTNKLTASIATYHAKALDQIGSFYYSQESFDDFYYGKGSTYPDVNGAVGILFEQASARGHKQDSENGTLTFPFAIKNQLTTTLSTLNAANDLRKDLLEHQRTFFKSALDESKQDEIKAFIFQSSDRGKMYHFVEMVKRHQIKIYHTSKDLSVEGVQYPKGQSYIVPLKQNQYRLISAMFERRTEFIDSLFYDVSAWTLPLAFNLEYSPLNKATFEESLLGKPVIDGAIPTGEVRGDQSTYAYSFDCQEYYSYRAISELFKKHLKIKVSTESMQLETGETITPGTIIIPVANQPLSPEQLYRFMLEIAETNWLTVYSLKTGFSSVGKGLGSPTVKPLRPPKVVLLAGEGISGYEVGEVWHLLDQRYDLKVNLLSKSKITEKHLNNFNTVVLTDGSYTNLSKKSREDFKRWIEHGGQVICWKRGAKWLSDIKIGSAKFKNTVVDTVSQLPYGVRKKISGAQKIGGAIFEVNLDLTHPLTYGLNRSTMPVFRNSALFMERTKNPFTNPIMYTSDPLMAGYIHPRKLEELKNTPAVDIAHLGKGSIISLADNPNFRAFWYGTNKLFLNALFFGSIIEFEAVK